jgi:hypothetical protein
MLTVLILALLGYLFYKYVFAGRKTLYNLLLETLRNDQRAIVDLTIRSLRNPDPVLLSELDRLVPELETGRKRVLGLMEPLRGHSQYVEERQAYLVLIQHYKSLLQICHNVRIYLVQPDEDAKAEMVRWLDEDWEKI